MQVIRIDDKAVLYGADCLDVLRFLPDNSVDSIVTDPPAGIAFMGKDWDKDKGGRDAWIAWMQEVAVECLRVVKPGGHALVWALPRTSHWTGTAWENAGWEPRDKITHLFGSGMPKSHSISKAIDRAAGAKREVIGTRKLGGNAAISAKDKGGTYGVGVGTAPAIDVPITAPATEAAKQWDGWGTALKPSSEDWWLLRKPLSGTVAGNVLEHGTGALNIDGCRIPYREGEVNFDRKQRQQNSEGAIEGAFGAASLIGTEIATYKEEGRWPANTTIDDSAEVAAGFPADGKGPLSRFFYCAKANNKDRDEGLDALPLVPAAGFPMRSADGERGGEGLDGTSTDRLTKRRNIHPTVKSTELMRYLTRIITPNGGMCLDPFMGSGSTGKACMIEGFRFVGIEQDTAYLGIAEGRIRHAAASDSETSD